MVGTIAEEHRHLRMSVSRRAIIGAIMDHHKEKGVNQIICRSFHLRIEPIKTQPEDVGGIRDLLDDGISSSGRRE